MMWFASPYSSPEKLMLESIMTQAPVVAAISFSHMSALIVIEPALEQKLAEPVGRSAEPAKRVQRSSRSTSEAGKRPSNGPLPMS
jgi:hypothetical protein